MKKSFSFKIALLASTLLLSACKPLAPAQTPTPTIVAVAAETPRPSPSPSATASSEASPTAATQTPLPSSSQRPASVSSPSLPVNSPGNPPGIEAATATPAPEESSQETTTVIYQDYSSANLAGTRPGAVVLFFHASWCPTCRAAEADILSNIRTYRAAPATILKVNYDQYGDLKEKYGVTYQHTFVLVDRQGNKIRSWSGSSTLKDIVAKAQAG